MYAPTEEAEEKVKKLYSKLEKVCERMPKQDFKAQPGRGDHTTSNNVTEKYSYHKKANHNGMRLCNFAAATEKTVVGTQFKRKMEHEY